MGLAPQRFTAAVVHCQWVLDLVTSRLDVLPPRRAQLLLALQPEPWPAHTGRDGGRPMLDSLEKSFIHGHSLCFVHVPNHVRVRFVTSVTITNCTRYIRAMLCIAWIRWIVPSERLRPT